MTLSGLGNTSNVTSSGMNNSTINGVDGGSGFAVLNLTSSFFSTYAGQLTCNLPSTGLPLIVNVVGTGPITWGLNSASSNKNYNPSVIWNFFATLWARFTARGRTGRAWADDQ